MKICICCNIEKPLSDFNFRKDSPDGYRNDCKVCRKNNYDNNKETLKEKRKIYVEKNSDRIKVQSKSWKETNSDKIKKQRLLNRDKINKQKLETYYRNREYYLNKRKEWAINNPEKIKEYKENNKDNRKEYRLKNKDLINAYFRERNNKDSEFKLKNKLRKLFFHSFKLKYTSKNNYFFKYTGLDTEIYINYFENNYPVEFSGITTNGKYHIDHIIPCAVYDFNNLEEIKKCWQPENLRLIPAKENLEKNNKLDYTLIEKHNIWHLLPQHLLKDRKIS